jgi:hypothetical protein
MPYSIESNDDNTVRVVNAITGKVYAKRTTRERAEAQIRIMEASESGRRWFRRRK